LVFDPPSITLAYFETNTENGKLVGLLTCHSERGGGGKLLSPSKRRKAILCVQRKLGVSERRACLVLGQARKTQRRTQHITDEEERLRARIIELATQYGRYGYRRITALLNQNPKEYPVNHDLEDGRLKGTQEATETKKAVAQ